MLRTLFLFIPTKNYEMQFYSQFLYYQFPSTHVQYLIYFLVLDIAINSFRTTTTPWPQYAVQYLR